MSEPLKLCRDCKWCRYPGVAQSTCTHDEAIKDGISLVDGTKTMPPLYCWVMRKSDGPCARDARLFEQRDETA